MISSAISSRTLRMVSELTVALAGIGSLGASCDPDPGEQLALNCEAGAADSEQIELGQTTDGQFVAFGARAALPLEFGNQGGQHVTLSVRFFSEEGVEWLHELTLEDTTGRQTGGRTYVGESCTQRWTRLDNLRVFVDDEDLQSARLSISSGPYEPSTGLASRTVTSSVILEIR